MDWRDDAAKNVALWTQSNRDYTDESASDNWALDEISWGIWGIDESDLNVLGDVAGLDVVELGCGTAYFSAWLAKLGARPVGVDVTPAQLDTARRMMRETGIEFPLVEADAAETGLPDASFDLVVSEYGASIWVDPVPLDPRSGAAAPSRRAARLPAQLDARDPLLVRRRPGARVAFSSRSSACTASSGRRAASSSTWRTASGSTCCARTGSRSSGWSRSRRRPTPRPITTTPT